MALHPEAGLAQAAASVESAWAEASPEVRSDLMDRVGDLILRRREEVGRLLSREVRKTRPEGAGEVTRAGRIFNYFAGEALRRHGQNLESVRPRVDI